MNDPNGTVFYQGEYHLFYQHNPEGNVWGHMTWGHAVSSDMVHWRNLPIALREEPGQYMVYSGSAVVDWENSSGLCKNSDAKDRSCLVAVYTAAYKDRQKQHIAFSNDRGRTWTNYSGNPVADLDAPDFRDPNVFWYKPQHKWVMVAVLADERTLVILDSPDLRHWTKRSTFGPAGDTAGQWECPDLIELPVEDGAGKTENKWVLIVNRNPGAPAGGTGVRYLIGDFDGVTFTSQVPDAPPLWADWGKDFYATNTWNDMPAGDGRESGLAGSATGSMRIPNPPSCGGERNRFHAPWRCGVTPMACVWYKSRSANWKRSGMRRSISRTPAWLRSIEKFSKPDSKLISTS